MRKSGFAPIAIVLIIAVVAVLGGVVFLSGNKGQPTTPNIPSIVTPKSAKLSFKKASTEKLLLTGGYADPTVVQLDNGTIILYVNKFGSGGSSYKAYTSTDGLTWVEKTAVTLPNAATGRGVKFESKVRFYYPGLMPIKPSDPPASIQSSISSDGFNFTKEVGERVKPKGGYYLEGPTVIKLADGTYRMYFNENETASKERRVGKIYGATSADGLAWTRDSQATIESDQTVEKAPSDWPQALHPFVIKRPSGGYLMLYNTHSKIYAATSEDGKTWTKAGYIGVEGADADGYYLPDGTLRLYFGNFTPQTSGVVYTIDLKEQ